MRREEAEDLVFSYLLLVDQDFVLIGSMSQAVKLLKEYLILMYHDQQQMSINVPY